MEHEQPTERLVPHGYYQYGQGNKEVNTVIYQRPSGIASDYEIIIPSLSKERILRKIIIRDLETKKNVVLLTNNLQWSATTVAEIYKER